MKLYAVYVYIFVVHFQIEEQTQLLAKQALSTPMGSEDSIASTGSSGPPPPKQKKVSALDKFRGGAKKALLMWSSKAVSK